MDGNGRWAKSRGLPRLAGHREGAKAVRRVVEAAPDLGIRVLSLFAFSSDNWQRPPNEVAGLMQLFCKYLRSESAELEQKGVRLSVIGRHDRLLPEILNAIDEAEVKTRLGTQLHLRVAIDYSARDAIIKAARRLSASEHTSREEFARSLGEAVHADYAPDVDLLIRTGGEQRLSDFFLWECAYAELFFTPRMWPDFDGADLKAAVNDFRRRERRFGRITEAVTV